MFLTTPGRQSAGHCEVAPEANRERWSHLDIDDFGADNFNFDNFDNFDNGITRAILLGQTRQRRRAGGAAPRRTGRVSELHLCGTAGTRMGWG